MADQRYSDMAHWFSVDASYRTMRALRKFERFRLSFASNAYFGGALEDTDNEAFIRPNGNFPGGGLEFFDQNNPGGQFRQALDVTPSVVQDTFRST